MASPEQVANLRKLANEPNDTKYDDAALGVIIDENGGNINRAASFIWQEKAASYAEMVDVSELGSSRALGDLHKQALEMADRFDKSDTVGGSRGTRIRSIERP